MSLRSFLFPVIYSIICILATCITFYGGHEQQINKVNIILWVLILPFCLLTMTYMKKVKYGNAIGGREAAAEGLTFVIISIIFLLIFQTIFFLADFKDYKINYMQTYGVELAKAQILNGKLTIKDSEIPGLISKEIGQVTLFREYTGLVFKHLFLGLFASFIGSVFLKNKQSTTS